MAQLIEDFLLEAIEKDDIKAFDALMEQTQCGGYRLGRFPVLSVLYLYKSRRIISAYEEKFIKTTAWEAINEPTALSKAFSDKAGKCLRLYLNEVVSPLEMLLILDNTKRLKRVYPLTKPSSAIKERLKTIYSVKYSLSIDYRDDEIIIDRRPLSSREKKKIATICLCSFLAVAIAVATPITTISLLPKHTKGEATKLSQIDFSKRTTYTLKEDITIPASYKAEEVNCTVVGEGHKIVFEKGATLGKLAGKISDAQIETSGSPIFSSISEKGELSSVTVWVNADIQTSQSSAFITLANYGKIDGVTVSVSGKISAVVESSEVTFGGMVLGNYTNTSRTAYGTITNCTVSYSDLNLDGETYANGAFGGIAGYNYGAIEDCTVSGSIKADTFDLAGVCIENGGLLSKVVNKADLFQTSSDDGWNPIVSGITYTNTNTVLDCENIGSLTAKSTGNSEEGALTVSVAGIVVANYVQYSVFGYGYECEYGIIEGCVNSGAINAEGNETVIVGGIVGHVCTPISYCLSSGDISAKGKTVYVGGIFGRSEILQDIYGTVYYGNTQYCISENIITVSAEEKAYSGGIGGYVYEGRFVNYSETLGYFGGGITNCFFLGSNTKEIDYCGNIVGASGENIYYETDLYYEDYHNFEGNYYVDESMSACGVTVTRDENNEEHFEVCLTDMGAAAATKEEIIALKAYRDILDKLGR